VRVERRWTEAGRPFFAIGLRGKSRSYMWMTTNSFVVPALWGSPPSLHAAVCPYNSLLQEAAALEVPAAEVSWAALFACVVRVYGPNP